MAAPGSGAAETVTPVDLRAEQKTKLDRLLAELRAHVERDGKQRVEAMEQNLPRSRILLGKVPLAHGMNKIEHLKRALSGKALLSRKTLQMSPLPSEEVLGIPDCVYTSAGIFYPKRRIALVFRCSAEDNADVTASPWDTGSFCASQQICPHLAGDARKRLFEHTHLPAPLYRDYLVPYVAACFSAPEHYLSQAKPRYSDPARAMTSDKWQSRVFEVRFRDRLPINATTLAAAFVPRFARDRSALSLAAELDRLEAQSVDVKIYDNSDQLDLMVRAWIRKHAESEGES